jgi:hypothetical protein
MPDTDLHRPCLAPLRAAAEAAELAQAVSGLVSIDRCRMADTDSLAPLARSIARSMTEAGLTVHHCARYHPPYRIGGVFLLPVPAEAGTGHGGVSVSWTVHDLLLRDQHRYRTYRDTHQAMNATLGRVLTAFGYQLAPFGSGGAWLVTGRRTRGTGGRAVTALAIAPETGTGYEPTVMTGVDRAIRVSTAVAVLAVAGVAAYVSYWHAYAVVCAHGETGITARLEPATIDGLVYASSMVNLYAARHRLPVPALARWLLALGIIATLAANMAQGWSHGPAGAVIAAWPAVSLVGSYELLVWIIRTAAAGDLARRPGAGQDNWYTDQPVTDSGSGRPGVSDGRPEDRLRLVGLVTASTASPRSPVHVAGPDQVRGSGNGPKDHADQSRAGSGDAGDVRDANETNAAAVAAYQASLKAGMPLSERKLAGMFGKTSRRWARCRMAEVRQSPVPA